MTYSGNTKEKLSETSRKYVLSVAYWRFFVNALLVLCDMTAFIIASAIVYVVRNAGDLYSTRFHFYLALWVYTLVGSLIWIYCLHSVGVYHRHVMGDGYQLNAFLVKGAIFAGLPVWRFCVRYWLPLSNVSSSVSSCCSAVRRARIRTAPYW